VTTSFDRSMKFGGDDPYQYYGCFGYSFKTCRALVDPTSSLWEQAKAVAYNSYYTSDAFYVRKDNTRWNEISFAADLPRFMSRAARMSNATLSVSARNLKVWAQTQTANSSASYWGASYDYGYSSPGVPQATTWQVRVDLDR